MGFLLLSSGGQLFSNADPSIILVSRSLFAADLESLAKEGYKVVHETSEVGEFKGCIAGIGPVRFTNGKIFVCGTFGYSFDAYMPKVYVLENEKGDFKVLINGNIYSGTFQDQMK